MINQFHIYIVTQFLQFAGQFDSSASPQLSPQQQGHILSDVQQHQHRFGLHQKGNNGIPQPHLFIQRNKELLAHSGVFGQQLVNLASQPRSPPVQFQQPLNLNSNVQTSANGAPNFLAQIALEQQKNSIVFPSIPPSIGTPSGVENPLSYIFGYFTTVFLGGGTTPHSNQLHSKLCQSSDTKKSVYKHQTYSRPY